MNDPAQETINIGEQRDWLNEHKKTTGLSWKQLGNRVGIASSTLSLFCGNNYNAPGDKIAEAIFRYRQTLTAQASIKIDLPDIPDYFTTETSERLIFLFGWAQRGRIAVAAMSPGLGKTITANHYKACNSNVFMVTATPATSSVLAMIHAVLAEMGIPQHMYRTHEAATQVIKRVKDLGNPLLIFDEAQHLSEKAIDQLRSWHDATKLGIALLGNANLLQTLEGSNRSIARAQLFSRISFNLPRLHPLAADIDAMINAWNITDEKICDLVHSIAMKPGGLRVATFALELAHMIAISTGDELNVSHLQDAWAQLSTRPVSA